MWQDKMGRLFGFIKEQDKIVWIMWYPTQGSQKQSIRKEVWKACCPKRMEAIRKEHSANRMALYVHMRGTDKGMAFYFSDPRRCPVMRMLKNR
jgi:hypothetical protein